MVNYDLPAIKLAEILQEKLLVLGINPVLRLGLTVSMEKNFIKKQTKTNLFSKHQGQKNSLKVSMVPFTSTHPNRLLILRTLIRKGLPER